MPDEITVKPKSEPTPATLSPENQTVTLSRAHLVIFCAVGLGVSFFLPWVQIIGANISGFDLQKSSDQERLLWAIPIFCAISIIASITKKSQQVAGQLTGTLPFLVGVLWYLKLGTDMFHVLAYGAFLSLAFGAALFIVSRESK